MSKCKEVDAKYFEIVEMTDDEKIEMYLTRTSHLDLAKMHVELEKAYAILRLQVMTQPNDELYEYLTTSGE